MSWWWLLGLWPFVALLLALAVGRALRLADEQECPLNTEDVLP